MLNNKQETDPLLQNKLDTMLQDIQALKTNLCHTRTHQCSARKIQEEEIELSPTTTVRPSNYNDKCNSLPLTMNKFSVELHRSK